MRNIVIAGLICFLTGLVAANDKANPQQKPLTQPEVNIKPVTDFSHYPQFSWDRIPLTAHMGKLSGSFTDEEAQFLATHFPLIVIEKTQGVRVEKHVEKPSYEAARQLKKYNPDTKVLFYLNTFIAYPMYDAHQAFIDHPEWTLKDKNGNNVLVRGRLLRYDLSKPDLREWWSNICRDAVTQAPFDGIFADAIPQLSMAKQNNIRRWGKEKFHTLEAGLDAMLRQTMKKIGPDKHLIYNGLRGKLDAWKDGGTRYLDVATGAMVEHFGHYSGRNKDGKIIPEQMAADIELIRQAGKAGKIIVVKGWPKSIEKLGPPKKKQLHDEYAKIARKEITFPLAAFLIAAEKYAYFAYAWNYHHDGGWLEWYPEYDKPLGPPKGPAKRNGWIYTRQFKHASVWLDIENEKAKITWH